MADSALLIQWSHSVRGREKEALALFGSSLEYYGALQSEGAIESFEPVLLDPASNDLAGFILIRGSAEQIDALQRQEKFVDLVMRGLLLVEGLGVVTGHIGGQLQARMQTYAQIVAQQPSAA